MLAYNQLIQPTENPSYFIYFEVDPQTIDINIHPTKTEIKFENEQALWSILSATVKEALGKFNIVPSIDFDREGVPDMPVQHSNEMVSPPKTIFNPSYNPFGSSSYKRPQMEWESLYSGFEKEKKNNDDFGDNFPAETESTVIQSKINIEEVFTGGIYFQLKNRFIITSVKSGMLMIDQRRAHIRILFDQFLKEIQQKKGFSQQLLFPETLQLMPEDLLFFEQIKADLYYVGFDFEPEVPGRYTIKGVPSQLKGTESIIPLLNDMIERVKTATGDAVAVMQEQVALALAETAALPSVQSLNNEEMTKLVEQLFTCSSHNHTPDGKPVMNILTQEEIQQRFK
jgi:DNA mismatch repair protein MutL